MKMNACVRMWKDKMYGVLVEVNANGGHLLAQLLRGNLHYAEKCNPILDAAQEIAQAPRVEDWGFYDSVGVYFNKDIVTLDHVVEEYGEFSMPLTVFIEVLKKWVAFLENEAVNEEEFLIDLDEQSTL
ncbi:hypothetical protein [Undibacterium squillarum]|uniref:hypothetical protein n=1 Tax=Undibacterium squillarum TaxID=1131567 RepID=UPI0035AFA6F0